MGRISQVLKPGGWLVIEDFGKYAGHPTNYGPAQLILDSRYKAMLNRKGLNPLIGEHLQDILQTTNAFSEINIKKIELTLSTGKELYGKQYSHIVRIYPNIFKNRCLGRELYPAH